MSADALWMLGVTWGIIILFTVFCLARLDTRR